MSLLIFIAVLVVLIWVHELGHFLAAKVFGIRVSEFAIGFPPRLFKIKFGETLYSFGALLVGGFVNIHGENDPSYSAEASQDKRSMASKPRPVQAVVIVAGVAMNLIFGWLALSAGYMAGMPAAVGDSVVGEVRNPAATIVQVVADSPAYKAGLRSNDRVEWLQTGTSELRPAAGETLRADQVTAYIAAHQDDSVVLHVNRDGEIKDFLAKPEADLAEGKKIIGVHMADIGVLQLPPHLALVQGAVKAYDVTVTTAQGLSAFLFSIVLGTANWGAVAGPVGIATIGSNAVDTSFAAVAIITAIISINLALVNLLPIPGLDGGRLLIIGIESIIRRPVSARITLPLTLAGFALIIMLMLAVTYHDIAKLVG